MGGGNEHEERERERKRKKERERILRKNTYYSFSDFLSLVVDM